MHAQKHMHESSTNNVGSIYKHHKHKLQTYLKNPFLKIIRKHTLEKFAYNALMIYTYQSQLFLCYQKSYIALHPKES